MTINLGNYANNKNDEVGNNINTYSIKDIFLIVFMFYVEDISWCHQLLAIYYIVYYIQRFVIYTTYMHPAQFI